MTFLEWLRAQAKADAESSTPQPFADLYTYGPYFARTLGENRPDPAAFKAHLDLEAVPEPDQEELLKQLVLAEATWNTDALSIAVEEAKAADPDPSKAMGGIVKAPKLKAMKCGFRGLDGVQCSKTAVEGAARCVDHGGAITDPTVRGSLLLLAYAQMTNGTRTAVDTLIDVMETSTNDLARVNAAKELLDRAGLSVDQHVTVTASSAATDTRADALERIKQHLNTTRDRLLPPAPDDDEIIDAEIVEEVAS